MGIKKIKLNYKPVAVRRSNEVAYEVSSDHVNAVNNSIDAKIKRNALEQLCTQRDAKNFIVKQSGNLKGTENKPMNNIIVMYKDFDKELSISLYDFVDYLSKLKISFLVSHVEETEYQEIKSQ